MKEKKGRINGRNLKLIAAVTMTIDHMGYLLLGCGVLRMLPGFTPQYEKWSQLYYLTRCVGRVAFPIYAFLLTEGMIYTRNWKKYGLRLGIFGIISEIPFDLVCFQSPVCQEGQNVIFTLLLGLLTVKTAEAVPAGMPEEKRYLIWAAAAGIGGGIAVLLKTDYDYIGVLLIVMLYLLRGSRIRQCAAGFLWLAADTKNIIYLWGLAAAFLFIWLYNGERGKGQGKYGFYGFYPIHLLVLYLIFLWMRQEVGM